MRRGTELTVTEYRALASFRHQLRRFLQFSENEARAAGLEPQQHQLMLAIKGLEPGAKPTVGELAARMLLKHHSVGELIDRLERHGAVIRVPDPDDARAVLVRLTEAGDQLLARLAEAHRNELESTGPELARSLRRVLRTSGVAA